MRRPDGIDPKPYGNVQTWSPRRWAWEFLRRNEGYQKACNEADTRETQERVAEQFGLVEFKNWKEGYSRNRPRFRSNVVKYKKRLTQEAPAAVRPLEVGELIIRVDLKSIEALEVTVEKKLRATSSVVKKVLGEHLLLQRREAPKATRARNVREWSMRLRVLDALASGIERHVIAEALYPRKIPSDASKSEKAAQIKNLIGQAREMTESTYLAIAALSRGAIAGAA